MSADSGARVAVTTVSDGAEAGTVTITLDGQTESVPTMPGETLLESARRAGMTPPYSCEAGNCGSCIATIIEGKCTMRSNTALSADEIEDGLVLTCQGIPDTASISISYDD